MRICKKICNECPFRKDSLAGWLGPHKIEDILEMQQWEIPFTCHKTRTTESTFQEALTGEMPIYRGFVASASASCKLFGQHPQYGAALRKLQDEITQEDKDQVLDRRGFQAHHEKYS